MKATRSFELEEALIRRFKQTLKPRKGIHLSDLDTCLGKSFCSKYRDEEPSVQEISAYVRGYALQHEVLGGQEEELELDGIKMSLDLPLDNFFIEFKSVNTAKMYPENALKSHWMRRAMGYCKAKGITEMYFAVWLAWAKEWPIYCFKVEFTQEEIDANWEEMKQRKEILEKALKTGEYPEQDFHEDWENMYSVNHTKGRCLP